MRLNEAVAGRLTELLTERGMTQYQLYLKSGVPKSTIANLVHGRYDSVKLRLDLSLPAFFNSPFFEEINLDP